MAQANVIKQGGTTYVRQVAKPTTPTNVVTNTADALLKLLGIQSGYSQPQTPQYYYTPINTTTGKTTGAQVYFPSGTQTKINPVNYAQINAQAAKAPVLETPTKPPTTLVVSGGLGDRVVPGQPYKGVVLSSWTGTGTPKASDINPSTNLPFGVNPNTGNWDTGYYNSVVLPYFKAISPSQTEVGAYKKTAPSTVDYASIEEAVKKEYAPYYERLLKESNYDYDTAKARLEEDYKSGLRVERDIAQADYKSLLGIEAPTEMTAALEDLNKRGMLQTLTGGRTTPMTATNPVTGEAITVKQPTNVEFGGVAGSKLALLRTSQQARQDAIQRALQAREEQLGTTQQRGLENAQTTKERTQWQLGQEKTQKIADTAYQRYLRKLQLAGTGSGEIVSPYV